MYEAIMLDMLDDACIHVYTSREHFSAQETNYPCRDANTRFNNLRPSFAMDAAVQASSQSWQSSNVGIHTQAAV